LNGKGNLAFGWIPLFFSLELPKKLDRRICKKAVVGWFRDN
jgi:hypothetical protein